VLGDKYVLCGRGQSIATGGICGYSIRSLIYWLIQAAFLTITPQQFAFPNISERLIKSNHKDGLHLEERSKSLV
jgi:hypothetical protein